MENNEKKDFKKTGKILIICMIAAMVLCPLICDWNGVASFFSSGGGVKLPTNTSWCKRVSDNLSAGDRIYCFHTGSGSDWGSLQVTFADMYVKIKGDKMYDRDGAYVGRIRLKSDGNIVIFGGDISGIDIDGTYYKR